MSNSFYTAGFLNKLAAYEKAAKSLADMTPEERAKADAAFKKWQAAEQAKIPKRKAYKHPETFMETLKYKGGRIKDYAGSLARGVASAAGVTALRAGGSLMDLATFIPELADKFVFGKMMGIDEGRGLIGRDLGNIRRYIDRKVHNMRQWSQDYDYRNRINGGFNRFLNGVAADTVGSFAGAFGGMGGFARLGRVVPGIAGGGRLAKITAPAFASFDAIGAIAPGRQKELRDRERWIWSRPIEDQGRFNPTSTATNQREAPTMSEYRKFNMPRILPTSYSGYTRIPYHFWHKSDGSPVELRPYGSE